jgi:hypothetical protein
MIVRALGGTLLALMLAVLGWRLSLFIGISAHALRWPFELDYGEGIVWQQANMMFSGAAYSGIDEFPAIVFHYTPLYHVVTRALAALVGGDVLYTGRAVSIGSTLLTGLVIALIVGRAAPAGTSKSARLLAGAGGGLAILCFWPVIFWAQLMRVDMLAFLLSFTGFWLGLKALERPGYIYAAALCFVAAVFTKQISVVAPIALFLMLLWLRPRLAFRGIGTCVALGLVVLGSLEWLTDGGFVRHVFLYNINRIEWSRLGQVREMMATNMLFLAAGLVTASYRIADIRRQFSSRAALAADPGAAAMAGVLIYLLIATLMLVSIIKVGSNINYLIEWQFALAMLVGTSLFEVTRTLTNGRAAELAGPRLIFGIIVVPLAIAAQAWMLKTLDFNIFWRPDRATQLEALSARVRAQSRTVISDDMVLLLRSGKQVAWEPAIFAELASVGVWNEKPFIERIRNHEFAMFITVNDRGNRLYDSRYNPAVADAMDAAYPVRSRMAGYTLHMPEATNAPPAAPLPHPR